MKSFLEEFHRRGMNFKYWIVKCDFESSFGHFSFKKSDRAGSLFARFHFEIPRHETFIKESQCRGINFKY